MDQPRRDPILRLVNLGGLAALALFAAMALFFWTHPNYVPPCNSVRARCPAAHARYDPPEALPRR